MTGDLFRSIFPDCSSMGLGNRQVNLHPDPPQEVGQVRGAPPQVEHVRLRLARQHQTVEMPQRRVHPGEKAAREGC